MFGGMPFFPEMPRPFNTQVKYKGTSKIKSNTNTNGNCDPQYRCYPVAMMPGGERSDVEAGGKIIMPPSALDQLTRLPILFSF